MVETPQYTLDRNRVGQLVHTNWTKALGLARSIAEPWFRCQALSTVAEHCPHAEQRQTLIAEAFKAAIETGEPNRIVTVSAEPLELLAKHGSPAEVIMELTRLRGLIEMETHPVRRSDALFALASRLKEGPPQLFADAVDLFLAHTRQAHGWKRDRNLKEMALLLHRKGDLERAKMLLDAIELPKVRRQALRILEGEIP